MNYPKIYENIRKNKKLSQMPAPCIEGGAGIQVSGETKPDQVFILSNKLII
jgi:hypothetical protein